MSDRKAEPILDLCARYEGENATDYDKSIQLGRLYKGTRDGKAYYFVAWRKGFSVNGMDPHHYRYPAYEPDPDRDKAYSRNKPSQQDEEIPF